MCVRDVGLIAIRVNSHRRMMAVLMVRVDVGCEEARGKVGLGGQGRVAADRRRELVAEHGY